MPPPRGNPAQKPRQIQRIGSWSSDGLRALRQVGGAAQHQMLLRARDRHVEDPPLLLLRRDASLGLDALEPCAVHRTAAEPGEAQAHAAVLRDPQRAVVVAAVLAEIGQAHDRELEALRAMHGHHPHRVERLGLERRLALAGLDRVPFREGVDEAAQVAALVRLVLARHPHQLADVGHPARATRAAPAGGGRSPVSVTARSISVSSDTWPAILRSASKRSANAARRGRSSAGSCVEQLGVGLAAPAPERGAQRPPRVATQAPRPQADQRHARRARAPRAARRARE